MPVVGLGAFVMTLFEPHKLWIHEVVDNAFPAPVAIATTATAATAICEVSGCLGVVVE